MRMCSRRTERIEGGATVRTLYLAGLLVLDLAVLALGGVALATMDLDKAETLGVVASVPLVLLVLSDFPVAHLALRTAADSGDPGGAERRITVLLASALTGAGALPLLVVTAAIGGPLELALACVAMAGLALVYAFLVGDRVAARHRARVAHREPALVRRHRVLPAVPPRARGVSSRLGGGSSAIGARHR
jgi:hypothetical protein